MTTLFLITLAIVMGAVEYVLVIMAMHLPSYDDSGKAVKPYPRVYEFVFKDCGLYMGWMIGIQQYIQWFAIMLLAMKYHSSAR